MSGLERVPMGRHETASAGAGFSPVFVSTPGFDNRPTYSRAELALATDLFATALATNMVVSATLASRQLRPVYYSTPLEDAAGSILFWGILVAVAGIALGILGLLAGNPVVIALGAALVLAGTGLIIGHFCSNKAADPSPEIDNNPPPASPRIDRSAEGDRKAEVDGFAHPVKPSEVPASIAVQMVDVTPPGPPIVLRVSASSAVEGTTDSDSSDEGETSLPPNAPPSPLHNQFHSNT